MHVQQATYANELHVNVQRNKMRKHSWLGLVGPRRPRSDLVVVDAKYCAGAGGEVTSTLARQISRNYDKLVRSSLYCGTRYVLAVLAHPTAQVRGGQVRFIGDFGVLVSRGGGTP